MASAMDVEVIYTSCSCNRTPFSADWGQNNLLAYGSSRAVVICKPKFPSKVTHTVTGHKDRINSVQWIRGQIKDGENELVSSSTDKSAIVWRKEKSGFRLLACLEGHRAAVTLARGLYLQDQHISANSCGSPRTLIATASVDFTVKIWERLAHTDDFSCIQTLSFGTGFVLALSWIALPGTAVPLLACGGDDQKIRLLVEQEAKFLPVHTLSGHEDWIRDIALTVDDQSDVLLASCSQDQYIRIWRMSACNPDSLLSADFDDLSADIHMKKTTFSIKTKEPGGSLCFELTLESVLQGHEGWIYSIQWHPPINKGDERRQPLALLSASIDKTMIIWRPDQETGIWIEQARMGAVGGNTLGFYGGMFSPDGQSVMAHGYQGSFQVWHWHQFPAGGVGFLGVETLLDADSWLPGVTVGGHFASVEDLAWDPEGGEFVVSVSLDQTTRLHGYWKSENMQERSWHELGRPQIHGYDIQCIAMISRWSFASGADEKVIRVFEAPKNVIENLGRLTGLDITDLAYQKSDSATPEGASVPALGLSNKAVFRDSGVPATDDRELHTAFNPQYPELYFSPLKLDAPPSEDNLLQNTLWAEVQKLYGHGYEIFALAYHKKANVLASACKAAKAEHAAVLLWDVSTWQLIGHLEGHSLTVTQLVFSHSGEYLLSVSRDRTWSLYKMKTTLNPGDSPYTRVAHTDKKTSVHTRIIWSAAWSPDDKYFITVSRDKKAVMWSLGAGVSNGQDCLGSCSVCSAPLTLTDSITAVDFAPCKMDDNSYMIAFGLDNGSIHIYKWMMKDKSTTDLKDWSQLLIVNQSLAHHLTVKRLAFRPFTGEAETKSPSSELILQLASCGADHMVKLYRIRAAS